jgi:hypothetical protein
MSLWATVTTKVFTLEFVRHFDPNSAIFKPTEYKAHKLLPVKLI